MITSKKTGRILIILIHSLAGWGFCGALIGIGRQFFSMQTTLIIHAIGAPVGFSLLSLLYFRMFHFTTPLQTALIFFAVVVGLDLFFIAPVVEKSFAMFKSVLGTWIPFALIFIATYITGKIVEKRQ